MECQSSQVERRCTRPVALKGREPEHWIPARAGSSSKRGKRRGVHLSHGCFASRFWYPREGGWSTHCAQPDRQATHCGGRKRRERREVASFWARAPFMCRGRGSATPPRARRVVDTPGRRKERPVSRHVEMGSADHAGITSCALCRARDRSTCAIRIEYKSRSLSSLTHSFIHSHPVSVGLTVTQAPTDTHEPWHELVACAGTRGGNGLASAERQSRWWHAGWRCGTMTRRFPVYGWRHHPCGEAADRSR
jgi:hypothetical protein